MGRVGRRFARWLVRYVRRFAASLERMAAPRWAISRAGVIYFRGERLNPLFVPERWGDVVKRDPCPFCGKPSDTEEHVIPRSQGGLNDASNIVGACKACNQAKGSQALLQFLIIRRRERFKRRVVSAKAKRNQARRAAKYGRPLSATLAEHGVLSQMGGMA